MPANRKMLIHSPNSFSAEFPFSIFRVQHSSEISKRIYQREFWKLIYIVSGKGRKYLNGKIYPIRPGSLFLVHPEDETTFLLAPDERVDIYNILFQPEMLAFGIKEMRSRFSFFSIFEPHLKGGENILLQREQLYILDANREIAALIRRMEREFKMERFNFQTVIKMQLLELLALIIRVGVAKSRSSRTVEIASYVDALIENHSEQPLDYDALATEAGISKSHLCRLYRKARGSSIEQALLSHRLQTAKAALLSESGKNVSEICFECGFSDLSYFYRAFKKAYGDNPGGYRRRFGL